MVAFFPRPLPEQNPPRTLVDLGFVFIQFYWVIPSFTESNQVLPSFSRFY